MRLRLGRFGTFAQTVPPVAATDESLQRASRRVATLAEGSQTGTSVVLLRASEYSLTSEATASWRSSVGRLNLVRLCISHKQRREMVDVHVVGWHAWCFSGPSVNLILDELDNLAT